jgi:hypothetical protein
MVEKGIGKPKQGQQSIIALPLILQVFRNGDIQQDMGEGSSQKQALEAA